MDCYGNGLCFSGSCECAPGWGILEGGEQIKNFTGRRPNDCRDKVCPVPCGEHGICTNGVCLCQQGWMGPNCKDPACPEGCNGHGQCTFQSPHSPGQCQCDYGWGGGACNRVALYTQLRGCANDCSGNGLCMDGLCTCNVGFVGPDCSQVVCDPGQIGPDCELKRCPNDCFGQGLCMNGKCNCWEGYLGADCYVPINCGLTCKNACAAPTDLAAIQAGTISDGASTACFNCVGQCMTSMGHPVLGVHNPFEDLKGTFLQDNQTGSMPTSPRRRPQQIEVAEEHSAPGAEAAHHQGRRHHDHHHQEVMVQVEQSAAQARSPKKRSHKHREVRVTRYGLLQKSAQAKRKTRRHHKEVSTVRIH